MAPLEQRQGAFALAPVLVQHLYGVYHWACKAGPGRKRKRDEYFMLSVILRFIKVNDCLFNFVNCQNPLFQTDIVEKKRG